MSKKNKKQDDLDTETTFADMNVEGFSWYDPNKKKTDMKKRPPIKLSRKEYWAMVFGALESMLSMLLCMIVGGLLVFLLAYLWLKP